MNDEPVITRAEADLMALRFLQDNGPHTIGPIEDESALAAALIFLDLRKAGLATSTNFGGGNVQFAITEAGKSFLSGGSA